MWRRRLSLGGVSLGSGSRRRTRRKMTGSWAFNSSHHWLTVLFAARRSLSAASEASTREHPSVCRLHLMSSMRYLRFNQACFKFPQEEWGTKSARFFETHSAPNKTRVLGKGASMIG